MNCLNCGSQVGMMFYYSNHRGKFCTYSCAESYEDYIRKAEGWGNFFDDYKKEGEEE